MSLADEVTTVEEYWNHDQFERVFMTMPSHAYHHAGDAIRLFLRAVLGAMSALCNSRIGRVEAYMARFPSKPPRHE